MIDETEHIRQMYRDKGSNPDLYAKDIFYYDFENISDIRRNILEIGRRFEFRSGESYKRIMGRCRTSTQVEIILPHKRGFFFKDHTGLVGAIPKDKWVKEILEKRSSISGFVFGEVYHKGKGYVLYEELKSLLILAIDSDIEGPFIERPGSPDLKQPFDIPGTDLNKWLSMGV